MFDVHTEGTFQSIPWHAMRFKDVYATEFARDEGDEIAFKSSGDSDDLGYPLARILNALESFPDGQGGDPATRRARMIVKRQARRAVRIIEDLFDVSADHRDISPLRRDYYWSIRNDWGFA